MKKLKLESLEVTSFETSPTVARDSGTVHAHNAGTEPVYAESVDLCVLPISDGPFECRTWSPADCPTDPDFCCTMGCTHFGPCEPTDVDCVFVTDPGCPAL